MHLCKIAIDLTTPKHDMNPKAVPTFDSWSVFMVSPNRWNYIIILYIYIFMYYLWWPQEFSSSIHKIWLQLDSSPHWVDLCSKPQPLTWHLGILAAHEICNGLLHLANFAPAAWRHLTPKKTQKLNTRLPIWGVCFSMVEFNPFVR